MKSILKYIRLSGLFKAGMESKIKYMTNKPKLRYNRQLPFFLIVILINYISEQL